MTFPPSRPVSRFCARCLPLAVALLMLCATHARAAFLDNSVTIALPAPSTRGDIPWWITVQSSTLPGETFASQAFQITPVNATDRLAVTVIFDETVGGFLRVLWADANVQVTLSDDLFEGTGLLNSRTFILDRKTITGPGTLTFQASGHTLPVRRVAFEWVHDIPVLVSPQLPVPGLIDAFSRAVPDSDINLAPQPASDRVQGSLVTAVLADAPVRIEQGVAFVADLKTTDLKAARVTARFAGLTFNQKLELWVNDRYLGLTALEVPDLADAGYDTASTNSAPLPYVGWRTASIYVPPSTLHTGENRIQFVIKGAAANKTPVAARSLQLQLLYANSATPPSTPETPAPTPAPDSSGPEVTGATLEPTPSAPVVETPPTSTEPIPAETAAPEPEPSAESSLAEPPLPNNEPVPSVATVASTPEPPKAELVSQPTPQRAPQELLLTPITPFNPDDKAAVRKFLEE